jgi:hypothetical protein
MHASVRALTARTRSPSVFQAWQTKASFEPRPTFKEGRTWGNPEGTQSAFSGV